MNHDRHNAMAPLSTRPTIPIATVRSQGAGNGLVAIKEAQIEHGTTTRERESRLDSVSDWYDSGYLDDISHLFGQDVSPIPRPSVGLRDHDYARGLSVSGYAMMRGLIVQHMVIITPEHGQRVIRLRYYVYGPGVTHEARTEEAALVDHRNMAETFLDYAGKAQTALTRWAGSECLDSALANAHDLDVTTIKAHWQASRATAAAALAEGFAPDAPLAF